MRTAANMGLRTACDTASMLVTVTPTPPHPAPPALLSAHLFSPTSPTSPDTLLPPGVPYRQSSIELLGTLLFSALGVANRLDSSEIADEETAPTMSVHAIGEQLRAQLGNDRYRSVLARLFIARQVGKCATTGMG